MDDREERPAPPAEVTAALPFRGATLLFPYRGPAPPDVTFGVTGDELMLRSRENGELRVGATSTTT